LSTIIGVFDGKRDAENAMDEIKKSGIKSDEISIVAREDQINEGNDEQDLTNGATTGGTLGGLAGLLAGAGALTIPGIGPVLAAGPLAAGISGLAAGGLTGSLIDLGVDEDRGQYYEGEVRKGAILASVETDQSKVNDVASQMRRNGARDVETH
jgi:uncharacterized membrane protein